MLETPIEQRMSYYWVECKNYLGFQISIWLHDAKIRKEPHKCMCYTRNTPISCDEFLISCKKMATLIYKGIFPLLDVRGKETPNLSPLRHPTVPTIILYGVLVPFPIQENFPFDLIFKVYLGIYRQHAVLKSQKSNVALLEGKMLFLYFLFLSCCFSVSMGSAIAEFQENFEELARLTNKEVGHYHFLFFFFTVLVMEVSNRLWASCISSLFLPCFVC